MIQGKTKNGFEFKLDENVANDMEFLDLLVKMDENPIYIGRVLEVLLGSEQKAALYDHIRDKKTGRVPIEQASDMLVEMLEDAGEDTKN